MGDQFRLAHDLPGMPEEKRWGIGFKNIKGFPGGRLVAGVIAASREMITTAVGCDPR